MAVCDLDIARAAHLFIQLHGDEATARAREMVEEMRRKGDHDGADTWLRIIVAIGELGSRRQRRGSEATGRRYCSNLAPGAAARD
jgi:hypothetical protein